jgi:hypothetical protein
MLNLFNNVLGVRYRGEYGLLRTAVPPRADRSTANGRAAPDAAAP